MWFKFSYAPELGSLPEREAAYRIIAQHSHPMLSEHFFPAVLTAAF